MIDVVGGTMFATFLHIINFLFIAFRECENIRSKYVRSVYIICDDFVY